MTGVLAGQAGLAIGYFLARQGRRLRIDAQEFEQGKAAATEREPEPVDEAPEQERLEVQVPAAPALVVKPPAPAQSIESRAERSACTEAFLKAEEIAGDGDEPLIRSEASGRDDALKQAMLILALREFDERATGRVIALRGQALDDELCEAAAAIRVRACERARQAA